MIQNFRKPAQGFFRRTVMHFRTLWGSLLCAILLCVFCAFPGFTQGRPNHYAVYLQDPPVASRYAHEALATQAAISYRQQIEARQAVVTRDLESRQIHVTGAVSTLINAIFIAT